MQRYNTRAPADNVYTHVWLVLALYDLATSSSSPARGAYKTIYFIEAEYHLWEAGEREEDSLSFLFFSFLYVRGKHAFYGHEGPPCDHDFSFIPMRKVEFLFDRFLSGFLGSSGG